MISSRADDDQEIATNVLKLAQLPFKKWNLYVQCFLYMQEQK